MKKLTLLFSFLFAGLWVAAQPYTITIFGTVTDPNGDPAANVQIYIATDSMPGGTIYFNTVGTGPDGTYSDSFSSSSSFGIVYITMANCPNVPSETQFFTWQGGNANIVANFVYCDVANNCYVSIAGDSIGGPGTVITAVPYGTPPFIFLWNTGETTPSITAGSEGLYCVTVTDASGCEAEGCMYVSGPQPCSVSIETNPGGGLTAWAQGGTFPFSYQWNNGSTSSTIFPNAPGEYCVTVTDANGCVAEACYWWQPGGDTLCSVYIDLFPIQGTTGYSLNAMANGAPPFVYLWSNGSSNQAINVFESGTYCVTVADSEGCTATECVTIQIQGQYYNIQGLVVPADSIINNPQFEGMAYLIQYDSAAGTLTAIDSVPFTSDPAWGAAMYNFGNVGAGSYLVKAFLTPDSEGYEDYLPTYHFNSLFWNEADPVVVPNNTPWNNVVLVPGVNPGGPGFIGGLVSEGANLWTGGGSQRGDGDPMPNVSIILLNDQEEPVTHALTHTDGTFGIENLAWGTYKVVVEIPGMEQGYKWVTLSPDNPSVNISFSVNEEGIVLGTKGVKQEVTSIAFPNPVKDQLSLYLFLEQAASGQLSVLTVDGKEVKGQAIDLPGGGQVLPIDLSSLKSGIYLLQITTGDWMVSHRVVKE
jgi:hypothetical protein